MPTPTIKRQKAQEAGHAWAKKFMGPEVYKANKKAAKWLQHAFIAGVYWHEDLVRNPKKEPVPVAERECRLCGCTANDCRQCVAKTGAPCHWVSEDLCSACDRKGGSRGK